MLLKNQKILFVHIPKTAGSSIEETLCQHYKVSHNEALILKNNDPSKGPQSLSHLTSREYIKFGYITQDEFSILFKFAFVRNPWSRVVSEYKWHRYYRKYTFKDWLFKFFPSEDSIVTMKDDLRWRHVMPQYRYIFDNDGKNLMNFIGYFENLNDDFRKLEKLLEQNFPALLKVRESKISENSIKKGLIKLFSKGDFYKNYKDYYDQETWNWVSDFYRKDIELFGYKDKL
ncbi:hypothetical protein NIES970_17630 [[Synechococcus] sp. NIES-970]|nr:hypothetical protein NIES970_17630 [[Synechococcus] sp. NIES-970]